jgi:hypothetical protein
MGKADHRCAVLWAKHLASMHRCEVGWAEDEGFPRSIASVGGGTVGAPRLHSSIASLGDDREAPDASEPAAGASAATAR